MSGFERTTTPAPGDRPSLAWFWPLPTLPPYVFEAGLAVVQVAGSFAAARGQPDRDSPDALGIALLIAGPAVLTARHRYPALVVWAVCAITIAYMLLGYAYGPVVFSFVVALFTAVMAGQRVAAWSAAAGLYIGHFGIRLISDVEEDPTLGEFVGVAAWLLAILAAFEVVRARRDWAIEAERTREEEARGRASEERLRISRELHDVLAHHISLMNVQAGVALHLMDRKPEQARTALTAIEAASREALGELRSVLDILQQPDGAPRAPAPGLGRLDGLTSQARAAGLDVRTEIEGSPGPSPAQWTRPPSASFRRRSPTLSATPAPRARQ